MSAPEPAVPSEGAAFYRFCDVPQGWEWRNEVLGEWRERNYFQSDSQELVEARPKPEPLVAVMLPKYYVEDWAKNGAKSGLFPTACRKALES